MREWCVVLAFVALLSLLMVAFASADGVVGQGAGSSLGVTGSSSSEVVCIPPSEDVESGMIDKGDYILYRTAPPGRAGDLQQEEKEKEAMAWEMLMNSLPVYPSHWNHHAPPHSSN
jgi:hypothetical protein